jgi:hypothetical protein
MQEENEKGMGTCEAKRKHKRKRDLSYLLHFSANAIAKDPVPHPKSKIFIFLRSSSQ